MYGEGRGETSRIRGERIESLGEYLDVGYSIETQRGKEREKKIGTIRREEGFFMNTIIELYPSSDEPPLPRSSPAF